VQITIVDDAAALADAVAAHIAAQLATAIAARGRAAVAFSGGSTPAPMLRRLAGTDIDWSAVAVFQVDERIAPDGSPARNARTLTQELLGHVAAHAYLMPVTDDRLHEAATSYGLLIGDVCGGVLDVVHLGLGVDGHTASLVPGDPAVDVVADDVAVSLEYQGHKRMTMTLPLLNRAREVVWQVAGADKAEAVAQLVAGDERIPAARVEQEHATLFADTAAASRIS
jgi:6-phosphogluconolactonase